jgi:hypothetical protein
VHHGTLLNQHKLDTRFLVCLLRVNASTCFGRYCPSSGVSAQLLFGVTACVECVLTADAMTQNAAVQSLLKMGEYGPKHVEALTLNKQIKKSVSIWC